MTPHEQAQKRLSDITTGDPVGGGHHEMVYRVLAGAWRARHAGTVALTPDQSADFFAWVGSTGRVPIPAGSSILVGDWRPDDRSDDSVLGATIALMEEAGPDGVTMAAIARRAGRGVGALHSTFGSLDSLLQSQHLFLQEKIHEADTETMHPTTATILSEEIARFFNHEAASAQLWCLTHQGLPPAGARELIRDTANTILHADKLDPAVLAAAYFIDAHRTAAGYSDDDSIPIPIDLRDLMRRALDRQPPSGEGRGSQPSSRPR